MSGIGGKKGRVLPLAIVALASVVAVLAIFAVWTKRQALETENWVETSTELLEREEIRDAIALYLVAQLFESVDVEGELAALLPPEARPLAGPAAGVLRPGVESIAKGALAQPAIRELWREANRNAHGSLIAIVKGGGDDLSTEGGVVQLDLAAILAQIVERTGLPPALLEKLPPDVAQLEILRADELEAAQTGVDLLEAIAWVLTAIALALYALAVYLGGDRRRETFRLVGVSFAAIGFIVLVARELASEPLADSLTQLEVNESPVQGVWFIGTSMLAEAGSAMLMYGLVMIAAAWLIGPASLAAKAREELTPYLSNPATAYGGLAALLILLLIWAPTPAFERLFPSLILIGFITLGVELLRRRLIGEFPDRVASTG